MADFTIASRIGQGLGQNAFAGGGSQMNPLNMMQLMQTMQLQRAAEQRALAGEARAQALHAPQLAHAQTTAAAGALGLKQKQEEDELSNLYAGFRQKYDDPFSDEALKEARKTNAKLYSTLLDQKTAHGKLAAETEAKTAEALTKKLELNQKTASLWLPALENGLVTDQKSYSAMRKDLLRGQENLASLFPEEYSPEAVAKFKQAFSGTKKISQMSMANGDILILVNGEPYGTVDPTVKGGAGVMPGVRPFGPANPPPADLPAAAPTAAPTGAQPRVAGPLAPEATSMTANALRRFEGFREQPYWDVNAYRTGYGSDTITTPEGRVVKVQPGMSVTREDAERDLARRTNEFASTAARQTGDAWGNLPPNAQAALTSVAYNYGSLPPRILGAVQSGNPEAIARAVEGLAMDNNGINYARRMQEAAMIRGQAMPAAAGSPAVSASIGATERGMMGQPQAPINAMAPLFAAQLMQQQNAMAAPQPAPANIAPGLTAAATPAASVAAPATATPEAGAPPRREDYATYGQFVEAQKNYRVRQEKLADQAAADRRALEAEARKAAQEIDIFKQKEGIKAAAETQKKEEAELKSVNDLLPELRSITAPGGLISQSTGSGAGAAFDTTAAFFGAATEGAKAAARLKPIADAALKAVPRFEGPQSDKDTQSYKEAAGELANEKLPRETRIAAGQEMLRLLQKRQVQIEMKRGDTTTARRPSDMTVIAPNGTPYNFPTKEQADAYFKQVYK